MCGRYGFSVKDAKEIYNRFDIVNTLDDYSPRWNIAPGQMNPTITRHSPKQIKRMFWGLIPYWSKDDSFKFKTINAREEGIEDKPVYRKPFRTQRCLIPATGFFEWDKSKKPSQPYYFTVKDEPIIAFAGLYDIWTDNKTGEEIWSYSIITTQANDLVNKIHPRMPVILSKENEEAWIDPDIVEPERLHEYLKPFNPDKMTMVPVSTQVNIPTIDEENLIKPLDEQLTLNSQ
jgi:putative SOS response-associated peptidase YedK